MTFVAVDWSGARDASSQRRAIWLAEVAHGEFLHVRSGFTRSEVAAALVRRKQEEPHLVVGFDFAFSFPAPALVQLDVEDAPALWELVADEGEGWMDGTVLGEYPLEGLIGTPDAFRRSEHELRESGASPRSPIDLRIRTGNVGRQSVRGFPVLRKLRRAGFAIWPFDEPTDHVVLEIYPRVLRRHIVRPDTPDPGRREVRRALDRDPAVEPWVGELARADDNAFDAIISALVLARHYRRADLPRRGGPSSVEGEIWLPNS